MRVVSWGAGEDSTDMLVELTRSGVIVDAILFADTGGEQQRTYDFIPFFSEWLVNEGQPRPVVVKYVPKRFKHWPPYYTLEQNCLTNGTLPSLAFGFKSCSLKWKVAPQDAAVAAMPQAQETWARGERVTKYIGYDSSPADIRRRSKASVLKDERFTYLYILQDLGRKREDCIANNRRNLGRNPGKSSCFFCPAMKEEEVRQLAPDHLRRIVQMEARAEPRLTTCQGLWRTATKTKPGSITEFIRNERLLPPEEIADIRRTRPAAIIAHQIQYRESMAVALAGLRAA